MDAFLLLMFRVCLLYAVLSVSSSVVVTCLDRTDLLRLLCVFVVFLSHDVPGPVWCMYLIVSIPDICLSLVCVPFPTFNFVAREKQGNYTDYSCLFILHSVPQYSIIYLLSIIY